jgi:hypothetical protein
MGKYLDEVRKLTRDPGAHRAAEVLDQLEARLNVCCPVVDPNPEPDARASTDKKTPAKK